jgi:excisionase family DNA binding protein
MSTPQDLITTTEAIRLLGISTHKMRDLIAKGAVKAYHTPLDNRKKLVSRAEVLKLKEPREVAA